MAEQKTVHEILRIDYLPQLNYAMWLRGMQCLMRVELENNTDEDWRHLCVTLTGEFLKTSEEHVELIPRGQAVTLGRLQIVPDADALRQLTESVATSFKITIATEGSDALLCRDYELRLMAFDEWPGSSVSPDLLASFVTPNIPQTSQVNVRAAEILERLTGSSALDEYQTQDPNRVRAQAAAIFTSLREKGIVYSAPPASFEQTGQRIRTVPLVMSQKLATCLDLALLVASCMEACGLHPLVVLLRGHAMVGCWLTNKYYPHTVGDDASLLLKSVADGINELVLIEATSITSSASVSFEEAAAQAEKRLMQNADDFLYFVDIFRCRLDGVRPLPLQSDGMLDTDGVEHDTAGSMNVDQRTTVAVDDAETMQPADRLMLWERKLLDFSMRNTLLNLRLTRKVIPFISFDPDHLEDSLQEGESYTLLPTPTHQKLAPDEGSHYISKLHSQELEAVVLEGIKHCQLYSYLTDDELATAIKTLYRESRTAMEENGADTLFLALGMLKWYETEKSVQPRYAPLVMLPVRLVRKSAGSYVLRMRDEDTTFNTTLQEMLRQQFGVTLTGLQPLPKDQSGVDMRAVFSIVRAHVKDFPRWDVLEESLLGMFSFSKFVMWNDIHNNSELMRRNNIVDALLKHGFHAAADDDHQPLDVRQADRSVNPSELAIPVDVDSSQLEAVIESGQGRSFILYGPPGTGKSQTITNIISNALFHEKRVLFVAEKMAALQVVQARMEKIGLAPFCLEMHSNKMTKSHLLHQLQEVLNLPQTERRKNDAKVANELMERRQELIGYVDELHRQRSIGLSLYDCIVRYEQFHDAEPLELSTAFCQELSAERLEQAAESLRSLDTVLQVSGSPSGHPLQGLEIRDASERTRQQLVETLPLLRQQADEVMRTTGSPTLTLGGLRQWTELIARQHQLLQTYTDQVLTLNARQLDAEWQMIARKWFLPRFLGKRNFVKRMQSYKADFTADELDSLCQQLSAIHELASLCGLDKDKVVNAACSKACLTLTDTLNQLCPQTFVFDLGPDPQLQLIADRIGQWMPHMDRCRNWAQWCLRLPALRELRLDFAIEKMQQQPVSGAELALQLQRAGYQRMALDIIDAEPRLQLFNGILFDETIQRYRQLAADYQQATKEALFHKLLKRLPWRAQDMVDNAELTQLKRWIASGGRGVSIRRIMEQLPTLLPQLCPCMLMSPISVAQYIDLKQQPFDLVIFDEASQMPTSESVGAIARGQNLIVVGDPKQMPPTNFFTTNTTAEQEADIDDMESILDDCITLSLPEHFLSWHYRSRHESLIAFSNAQYYDGRLYTFPSVDDRNSKVTFVPVDGTYDYGRTRSNKAEAEAIVKETLRRLPQGASIGIVAFSKVQQNLIEDLLTDELAHHPDLERLAYDVAEPVFVKNLENVQGDERDVILFSVGYGPDKNGKVSMNFGPLNNRGGERRLNVAVSRARREMMVFSTLQPEQIDLSRSSARGVEGLKRFLEYAKSGRMAVAANQIAEAQQPDSIVTQLAQELQRRGHQVDTKVGRSRFKVDLAIIDPNAPDTYLLGILCDGPNYYETKTERDREVVQPTVLRGLKWQLMRVWTIDWFQNKQSVIEQIEATLHAIADATPRAQDLKKEQL